MVTADELYYLNRALDGKEIFGVSRSKSVLTRLNGEKTPEESLIKKGILNSNSSINQKSYEIIRNLEIYKKADQYINLHDIFISIETEKDECVFIRNDLKGGYIINSVSKHFFIHYFMKQYPFIAENTESTGKEIKISLKDFNKEYLNGVQNNEWFYLKKGTSIECNNFYIYFRKNNVSYRLDVLNKVLSEISPKDIRIQLLKLFNVKGSYKL